MPSESTEMYLITIYRLTQDAPRVHIRDIAERLGFHPSSASEKVRWLSERAYVEHDAEGVALAEAGRKVAVNVLRKHRLIKTFLVQMAGYPLDEVYDEACTLEHAITDRFADALERMLGYPSEDPHGYPIPTREGEVRERHYQRLNDYGAGDALVIRRVDALNQAKLSYLKGLGLIPGATIQIEAVLPFGGPLMLRLVGAEAANAPTVALAPALAEEIEVERA